MKILFFIGALAGGGAERVTCNLSSYLADKGHYVEILTMSDVEPTYFVSDNVKRNSRLAIPELQSELFVRECTARKNDGAIYISGSTDHITVRSRKEGDIFFPSGMSGSKKVKEYFINEKIPRNKRNTIPIIEVNGQIASVGNRVDRRFLFSDNGLRIEFKPMEVQD